MSILVSSVIRMQYTELREMKAIPTQLSDQSLTKKEWLGNNDQHIRRKLIKSTLS